MADLLAPDQRALAGTASEAGLVGVFEQAVRRAGNREDMKVD